jgi:hypothetical protein
MIIAVMLTLGVAATTTACGTEPGQEDRMRHSGSTGVTTDQAVIDEALRFGGITLPPSARVLGVQYDKGIDQRYRLAIGIDPNSVETLLSRSGFTTPLEPDPGPFMAPVDGFDLTTATTVSSTSNTLAPQGERSSTVFRRVAVDRSDPAEPVVHVWLFTT